MNISSAHIVSILLYVGRDQKAGLIISRNLPDVITRHRVKRVSLTSFVLDTHAFIDMT